ncbi:MAG: ferritin-like domain-containing protein [Phycisphaerales bacterium]|nr:MAG: ferritin-like domain-containing protein [Phycisphaerales bacterium]
MAQTNNWNKGKIIQEFETMKALERSAHDLYSHIAAGPELGPQKIKTTFASLAADEQRHADLVQEIINLVTHAL